MSREKSQFLSGFGTALQIFKAIADAVLEAGGSDDDLRRVLSDKGLATKIAKVIVNELFFYKVTVDYKQTVIQMIQAGKYDWINDDITAERFPIQGEGEKEVEVTLFHFGWKISSETAISAMDKAGYRPATIEELLALGSSHPRLQGQFPVMALGSAWQDSDRGRCIPCLDWGSSGRSLGLRWFETSDWREYCRFAAVRK